MGTHENFRSAQKDRIDIFHYFTRVYLFYYSIFLGIATCFFLNLEEPDGWFDALGPHIGGVGPPRYSLIWKMRPDFES